MNGATIAQLILILGPEALGLIPKLAAAWNKELTLPEVLEFCATARKSYDEYIVEAKAELARNGLTPPPPHPLVKDMHSEPFTP